jgi:hypothetical protein
MWLLASSNQCENSRDSIPIGIRLLPNKWICLFRERTVNTGAGVVKHLVAQKRAI